jgi:DNA polymerase-3 subunit beta
VTETTTGSPFGGVEPPGGTDYGEFSFTAKRFILADLAEWASAAVISQGGDSTQRPILACFQVRTGPGMLRLAATDMERTIIAENVAVTVTGEDEHQVYLPARRLLSMLREAPEGDITVSVKKNMATVTAGGGVHWDLKLWPPDDYPQLADPSAAELHNYSRVQLLDGIKAVRHAMCKDAGRVNLTQLAFTTDAPPESALYVGTSVVTAIDGNRCARASVPSFPLALHVPSSVLPDLLKLLSSRPAEHVGVGELTKALVFKLGDASSSVTIAINKRHAAWPNTDQTMLKAALHNDEPLEVDKDSLLAAIRRVRINADESTSAIALDIAPGNSGPFMLVRSRDTDGNAAEESVQVKWEGGERVIVVNHVHLTDMLEAHPEQWCTFKLGKDSGTKLSMVLLAGPGRVQCMTQMPRKLVGY